MSKAPICMTAVCWTCLFTAVVEVWAITPCHFWFSLPRLALIPVFRLKRFCPSPLFVKFCFGQILFSLWAIIKDSGGFAEKKDKFCNICCGMRLVFFHTEVTEVSQSTQRVVGGFLFGAGFVFPVDVDLGYNLFPVFFYSSIGF